MLQELHLICQSFPLSANGLPSCACKYDVDKRRRSVEVDSGADFLSQQRSECDGARTSVQGLLGLIRGLISFLNSEVRVAECPEAAEVDPGADFLSQRCRFRFRGLIFNEARCCRSVSRRKKERPIQGLWMSIRRPISFLNSEVRVS